jgi:hypothetical protein
MGARNRVGGCRGVPGPDTPPAAAGAGLAKPTHKKEQKRITELGFLNILWGLGTEYSRRLPRIARLRHTTSSSWGRVSKICIRKKNRTGTYTTLQGKSHLCIPRKGIARPQPQFPHSCVFERFKDYQAQAHHQQQLGQGQ